MFHVKHGKCTQKTYKKAIKTIKKYQKWGEKVEFSWKNDKTVGGNCEWLVCLLGSE